MPPTIGAAIHFITSEPVPPGRWRYRGGSRAYTGLHPRRAAEDTLVVSLGLSRRRVYPRDFRTPGERESRNTRSWQPTTRRISCRWFRAFWPRSRFPVPRVDMMRTVPYPGAVSKQGFGSLHGYSDRLRALGMSDVQLREIAESKQLPTTIEAVAPADGFILIGKLRHRSTPIAGMSYWMAFSNSCGRLRPGDVIIEIGHFCADGLVVE